MFKLFLFFGVLFVNICNANEVLNIKIKSIDLSDLKYVSELCTQLGFPAKEASLKRRIELIKKYPTQIVLVAKTEKGNVVGWIHAYEAPSLLSDATVEIGGLVVDQKMRRHGVGKSLMNAVEQWAHARGFKEILLATRTDRLDAQAFYKAIGYVFVHTTHFLSKDLEKSVK